MKRLLVAVVAVSMFAAFVTEADAACGRGRLRGAFRKVLRPVKAAANVVKSTGGNCKGGSCHK